MKYPGRNVKSAMALQEKLHGCMVRPYARVRWEHGVSGWARPAPHVVKDSLHSKKVNRNVTGVAVIIASSLDQQITCVPAPVCKKHASLYTIEFETLYG